MLVEEKKQFNILVVDDNTKNIQVIGNILKEANYLIGFATNGEQALELLHKSNDYDLILLDINMPVMNGFDTCIAIRKEERLKEIPVIFLTAYTDKANILAGFDVGAQDYITKPFNSQELLARVHTHLQLKHKTDLIKKMNEDLEIKVAERTKELEKANSDLNNLDGMKMDFLVFISQEIRSPLNAIVGTVNMIKNQEQSNIIKNLVETLDISVSKLEEFTSKALFFNQLTQRKYQLGITDVNIKDIIQFSILEITDSINEKNIHIKYDAVQNGIFMQADKDLMFKAFLYILDNAVKFTTPNSAVDLCLSTSENNISFSCTDHGPGFPEEILSQLRMPFQLVNDLNHQKSVLSLYTIKQITNLHNGEFRIFNKEDAGGCVELIFPKK